MDMRLLIAVMALTSVFFYSGASAQSFDETLNFQCAGTVRIAKAKGDRTIWRERPYQFNGNVHLTVRDGRVLNETHKCGVEDAPWAKGQKELRIIDTLEPVMNQHRLVVGRSVIEADLAVAKSDQSYSLFYQMSRITKERGSLAHDDRLEAVAGAVFHWVEAMARDVNKAEDSHRDKMQDAELKRFKKGLMTGMRAKGKPKAKSMLRVRR